VTIDYGQYFPEYGFPSEQDYKHYLEWAYNQISLIYQEDSLCASGVPVLLPNDETTILSAKHVIIRAIWTGEITAHPFPISHIRSIEPCKYFIDARKDIGFAFIRCADEADKNRCVSIHLNKPTNPISNNEYFFCCGAPIEWNPGAIKANKASGIPRIKYCSYATLRSNPDKSEEGFMRAEIYEKGRNLPKSFEGMSGGPVFDIRRNIIGIGIEQKRGHNKIGYITVALIDQIESMYEDYVLPFNESFPTTDKIICKVNPGMISREKQHNYEISLRLYGRDINILCMEWHNSVTRERYLAIISIELVRKEGDVRKYEIYVPWKHLKISNNKYEKDIIRREIEKVLKEAALNG
jgi:hypothetical protein